MYICMHACMYYVCMCVRLYVCMYAQYYPHYVAEYCAVAMKHCRPAVKCLLSISNPASVSECTEDF